VTFRFKYFQRIQVPERVIFSTITVPDMKSDRAFANGVYYKINRITITSIAI